MFKIFRKGQESYSIKVMLVHTAPHRNRYWDRWNIFCIDLCGVHTAQRQIPTQIPIGFCSDCIGIFAGLCFGVWQCECTIKQNMNQTRIRSTWCNDFMHVNNGCNIFSNILFVWLERVTHRYFLKYLIMEGLGKVPPNCFGNFIYGVIRKGLWISLFASISFTFGLLLFGFWSCFLFPVSFFDIILFWCWHLYHLM